MNRGRAVDRTVRHLSRSKDIHRTFLCVWKQSSNITQLFFLGKFLTLQYFHIFEFSSSLCLFGFGHFRCALVFLILILCVWLRENVCMCPYVCCGGRAMWRRCACDRDIERCECANYHAWVRHRQMPIHCVYMRERCACPYSRIVFTHTQKGSVDVLRARHGDTPFDRLRGRGSRACTWFRIAAVVLTNKRRAA